MWKQLGLRQGSWQVGLRGASQVHTGNARQTLKDMESVVPRDCESPL